MAIYRLGKELMFPPHVCAEDGLLAVGGDLRPERLLLAYSNGIFPWFNEGEPVLWWSPDPRMVMLPNRVHVSGSLKRTLKRGEFHFSLDTAFDAVVRGCARTPRHGERGTWITEEMRAAYNRLYELGFAHSVEVWKDRKLAGGLYGVALGNAFFGESMFSLETDASKAGLAVFARQLCQWHFSMIDCQLPNEHLRRLGGFEMSRNTFLRWLATALQSDTKRGRWRLDSRFAPQRASASPAVKVA